MESLISNHHAISVDLFIKNLHPVRKTITFRHIKDIDTNNFKNDILESDLYAKPAADMDEKVMQYDDVLQSFLDKYAPEKMENVAIKDNNYTMDEQENCKCKEKGEEVWKQLKEM